MSNRIAIVCEGPTDFPVAQELIDQTLIRCVELHWINDDADLGTHRMYCGTRDGEPFVKWSMIDTDETKDYRRAIRSMFREEWPSQDTAVPTQRVLFEFLRRASDAAEAPPYIVIVKDTDNDPVRAGHLRDVRRLLEERKMPALLAVQHTELECWLLAAFQVEDDGEKERLAELCRGDFPPGVGFNPCEKSHQLTATKKDDEKLSPKRVLKYLSNDDRPREYKGLHRDNHTVLKRRSTGNGLADFLHVIERRLVPSVFGVVCS